MEIKWIGSPNFRTQNGIQKKFIVMHWMVGTLAGTDKVFQSNTRKVATNYGIEGKKVHQYVKDKDYAFGSGTTYANKFGISIEHEGGQLLKDGTRKKPTKSTHDTSAELCAKIAREHGMGKLVVGENMFPHKKFVSTQCPGSLDLKYIADKANEINAAFVAPKPPAPTPSPAPVDKNVYYTIKSGDSYWKIAGLLLKTKDSNRIAKEVARLQKLNNNKALRIGDRLLVKKG